MNKSRIFPWSRFGVDFYYNKTKSALCYDSETILKTNWAYWGTTYIIILYIFQSLLYTYNYASFLKTYSFLKTNLYCLREYNFVQVPILIQIMTICKLVMLWYKVFYIYTAHKHFTIKNTQIITKIIKLKILI